MSHSITAAPAELPETLARDLDRLLSGPALRVQRLTSAGARFWLKRPEQPRSWRWRLQKGDPVRAFEAERDGLQRMAQLGAPVPRIVTAGRDFMLIEDAGPTLQHLLDNPQTPEAEQRQAVADAARALGRLHGAGLAHGRPYLRDICWDGAQIRMIDFERFSRRNSPGRQGKDAILFLSSLLSAPQGQAMFELALSNWRAEAGAAAWRAASRWVAVLRVVAPLARGLARLRSKQSEIAGFLLLVMLWPRRNEGRDQGGPGN